MAIGSTSAEIVSAVSDHAAFMLTKFRRRYEIADPIGAWRRATPALKANAAFLAVCLDPSLLDELDTVAAQSMASAADAYAQLLREAVPDPTKSPVGAAAAVVLAALGAWREKNKPFRPKIEILVGRAIPFLSNIGIFKESWHKVRRGFPQFEPVHAGMCLLAVDELGSDGLELVHEPELLMVGAARFAAWSASGRRMDVDPAPEEQCAKILGRVHSWCQRRQLPVLDVAYTGPLGRPWQQALSLAADAEACAKVVAFHVEIVPQLGAELWGQAAARHAFASLALEPNAVADLDISAARELARQVIMFTEAAEAHEAWAIQPRLPVGMESISLRRGG